MVEWNGGIANSAKMRSKGHNVIKCLVDNFGIQVDADIKFNDDECANQKWPVGYHHCRKHPHFCIVNSSLYVATQSIVILNGQ